MTLIVHHFEVLRERTMIKKTIQTSELGLTEKPNKTNKDAEVVEMLAVP